MKSRLMGALAACALALSFNINAATIIDNGTYTTVDGVDWLDLTATAGMSYNHVYAELGPGGAFDGWSYATGREVELFWNAFGGDQTYYNGWSVQNNGLFDAIAPLWGDLVCESNACTPGEGYSQFIIADTIQTNTHIIGLLYDYSAHIDSASQDLVQSYHNRYWDDADGNFNIGSALTRVSSVPVPAAAWLFGSGLLGLIGVARRRTIA